MNAPENIFLPDVQASADTRRLAIQNVGVRGLRYPLQLETAGGEVLNTVANLTMTVGLPHNFKGTHMSRFVELLEGRSGKLTQESLFLMLEEMLLRLDAEFLVHGPEGGIPLELRLLPRALRLLPGRLALPGPSEDAAEEPCSGSYDCYCG